MTVADQNDNKIESVAPSQPPSTISQILNGLKIAGLILAGLAGSIVAAAAGGATLPAWLVSIATAVVAIAAPLGLASPGLKALQGDKK